MLQTKARYNFFRLNAHEGSYEPWCIEDLRETSLEEIWNRLAVEEEAFFRAAERSDTPEDLFHLLFGEREDDQGYLLLFELWRRFFPEKQSISIFCDELDYRLDLYRKGKMESDESIQNALANLQEILDKNVDAGADPIDLFEGISAYCAHDLEGFLCQAIATLLDAGNTLYASELLDGFSIYLKDSVQFELLQEKYTQFTE